MPRAVVLAPIGAARPKPRPKKAAGPRRAFDVFVDRRRSEIMEDAPGVSRGEANKQARVEWADAANVDGKYAPLRTMLESDAQLERKRARTGAKATVAAPPPHGGPAEDLDGDVDIVGNQMDHSAPRYEPESIDIEELD